jgi:ankyrin repeat protein
MELGDWDSASDRLQRHPRESRIWATLRTKSCAVNDDISSTRLLGAKRLALHHACFKMRSAGGEPVPLRTDDDPFVRVCKFVLQLVRLYPEAAGQRESRHGCLPLHLAVFASCVPRPPSEDGDSSSTGSNSGVLHQTLSNIKDGNTITTIDSSAISILRPARIARRVASDSTTETHLSAVHAEETYTGGMADRRGNGRSPSGGSSSLDPNVSVAVRAAVISPTREALAVQVCNVLLDAYPKAVRVDSEGGRLPLHTACAGRATPKVMATLVRAYPAAARHRNKDGFLPLHLAAHWGVSHPDVAVILLKAYPDATLGRNRWERTPLEEALCMAGENGRPHQSALVRALRKHPSYWSRATPDILAGEQKKSNVVDIDESLPSSDGASLEESWRPMGPTTTSGLPPTSPRLPLDSTRFRRHQEVITVDVPVPTLIQNLRWRSVLARLELNPHEGEEELTLMTRGGFYAGSGMAPLHYACERQPPRDVVEKLVELYPMAVMTRTMPGGSLPIHVACTWYASLEVISVLLAADAGSRLVTDELGNVPLHSACFSGAPLEIIHALLAVHPETVLCRNYQGSRPADVCKRLRHDNRASVLALLTQVRDSLTSGRTTPLPRPPQVRADRRSASAASHEQRLEETDDIGVEVSYQKTPDELVWI